MATAVDKAENVSTEVEAVGQRSVGATVLNTFSAGTRADKVRAYLAIDATKSLKKEKMIGVPFNLTNVLIREEQYVDDKGNVNEAPSVIMEAGEGNAYYMSSSTLAESVQNIVTAFGPVSDWADEPMTVQVIVETSRNGRDFYRMVPAV